MDQEAVQVLVAPSEGMLEDCMEWRSARLGWLATSRRRHTNGLDAAEHDAKLIEVDKSPEDTEGSAMRARFRSLQVWASNPTPPKSPALELRLGVA
ncbi:MAG: hypothetical protein JO015_07240 [Verrucomicrobia bacterium]|nr:hypothetical protein [Verrucomicrobiota bacterium]